MGISPVIMGVSPRHAVRSGEMARLALRSRARITLMAAPESGAYDLVIPVVQGRSEVPEIAAALAQWVMQTPAD